MSKLLNPKIEEIFIIEKDSGMLMGSFSKNKTIDQDMIAGMLTAIKAFVEDAFEAGSQELDGIDYDNFKIIVKSFKSFYISVVTSGGMSTDFKDKLDTTMLDFADKVLKKARKGDEEELDQKQISGSLEEYFNDFDHVDQ